MSRELIWEIQTDTTVLDRPHSTCAAVFKVGTLTIHHRVERFTVSTAESAAQPLRVSY
jgi:hypothetical protein